jgi:hypothetical protein
MTQTYTPPAPATSATFPVRSALVATWAVFTLGALGFVALLGTDAPYADEWEFVPALLGDEPAGPWLWRQHNEHRFPLPRLIYLALFRLTHDFRSGMLFQVALLSALALGLMHFAARLRGRPHWSDAFFPVSLLHIGHWENFVMGYQLCFALYAVLATGLFAVALTATRATAFRSGLIAGVLALLIVTTGGSGLVVALPVCGWVAYLAAVVWRGGAKGGALLLLLFAVLPLVYLGAYFVDYHKPDRHPDLLADPVGVLRTAGEVLGVSFGMGFVLVWWLVAVGVVVLGVLTGALLVRRWKLDPDGRSGVVGLLAVAAGVAGVALAIGVGRGNWGAGQGLWSRYSLLVWPLLAAAYLAWVKAGRKWVPIVLCVVAALAFPGNMGVGMQMGAMIKSKYSAIEADARVGLSAEQIVARQFPASSHQGQEERAVRAIPLLRAAGVGIFSK